MFVVYVTYFMFHGIMSAWDGGYTTESRVPESSSLWVVGLLEDSIGTFCGRGGPTCGADAHGAFSCTEI